MDSSAERDILPLSQKKQRASPHDKKKLAMSYDKCIDERYPLVTLTLPELYKLRANCASGTGVTWHKPAERLTYKELYAKGIEMAKGLIALGLKRGDNVMSIGVDGSESTLMFIAASSIGVIFSAPYLYSPVRPNVEYNIKRLAPKLVILGNTLSGGDLENAFHETLGYLDEELIAKPDAQIPVVFRDQFTSENNCAFATATRLKQTPTISELMEMGRNVTDDELQERMKQLSPNEPCFYTFSSGSTGVPKMIVIGASVFTNSGSRRSQRWCTSSSSRYGCASMCTEDFAMIDEVTAGFYTGHEILSVPASTTWDVEKASAIVLEAMQDHGTEMVYVDSFLLAYFVNNPEIVSRYNLPNLRSLMLSGAGSAPSFKQSAANLFPDSIDVYGLSECFYATMPLMGEIKTNLTSVGKCVVNQEIKIVDDNGNTVACNTRGEICLKGPAVMLEYSGQPELTRSVLSEDGWLKTGDCGVMSESGDVQIVGRMTTSERFNVSSDVVYAQPIEKIMRKCPMIEEIVVVGRSTGTPIGDEIVYCIVLSKKGSMTSDEVFQYAQHQIQSSHELPQRIFFYDKFPRSGSRNKVSRKLLTKDVEEKVQQDFYINACDVTFLQIYEKC